MSDCTIETIAMLHAIAWCIFGFGGLLIVAWFAIDAMIYRLRLRHSSGRLSSENLRKALETKSQ